MTVAMFAPVLTQFLQHPRDPGPPIALVVVHSDYPPGTYIDVGMPALSQPAQGSENGHPERLHQAR